MSQFMVQISILIIFLLFWAIIIGAGVLLYRWLRKKKIL